MIFDPKCSKIKLYNGVQHCTTGSVKGGCFTVSIKDYAREAGVSYEAVRKQMKRYSEELEGHIHQQGRTQYLDDEAVAFLDQHRLEKPIVVYEAGYDRQLRELEDTIAQLRAENEDLNKRLTKASEKVSELAEWKADNAMLIAEATQTAKLLEATNADLDQARKDAEAAAQRAAELEQQLQVEAAARAEAEDKYDTVKKMGRLKRFLWKGE